MVKKSTRKLIDMTANWLLVLAGINWALGMFGLDLISSLANATAPLVGTIVLAGIGIASLWIGGRMVLGKFLK